MPWKDFNRYFINIPDSFASQLFDKCTTLWDPLTLLSEAIAEEFRHESSRGNLTADTFICADSEGNIRDESMMVVGTTLLDQPYVNTELNIKIGKGTLVESGATIKRGTIVGNNCEIRQGAYIRGNCYIGDHCTVGHTTEMKNSIFIHHVEAGHFAYVGDSIIGSYVNLGAGTKISNLEFRTLEAKREDHFPEIKFRYEGDLIKPGISKFGAVIGDGVETGCNSVLSPFVFLEPNCWVLPNVCVLKGFYKQRSIIRDK